VLYLDNMYWEDAANAPSMTNARRAHGCIVVDDTLWVIGTVKAIETISVSENIGDSWDDSLSLEVTLWGHRVVALGSVIYVIGGASSARDDAISDAVYTIDAETGSVLQLDETLPYAVKHMAVVVVNGTIYGFGGYTADSTSGVDTWMVYEELTTTPCEVIYVSITKFDAVDAAYINNQLTLQETMTNITLEAIATNSVDYGIADDEFIVNFKNASGDLLMVFSLCSSQLILAALNTVLVNEKENIDQAIMDGLSDNFYMNDDVTVSLSQELQDTDAASSSTSTVLDNLHWIILGVVLVMLCFMIFVVAFLLYRRDRINCLKKEKQRSMAASAEVNGAVLKQQMSSSTVDDVTLGNDTQPGDIELGQEGGGKSAPIAFARDDSLYMKDSVQQQEGAETKKENETSSPRDDSIET